MAPSAALPDGSSVQSGLQLRDGLAASSGVVARTGLGAGEAMPPGIAVRSVIARRALSTGSIVGVSIGTFVGVVLLVVCLYPFVVHLIKRWRHRNDVKDEGGFLDAETGDASSPGSAAMPQIEPTEQRRRMTWRQSFSVAKPDHFTGKQQRQNSKDVSSFSTYDGPVADAAKPMPQRVQSIDRGTLDGQIPHGGSWGTTRRQSGFSSLAAVQTTDSSQVPPQPLQSRAATMDTMAELDPIYSRGGQNESYYSQAVLPEDLGMITPPQTEPVPPSVSERTNSRSGSFKANVVSMWRKRVSKDSHRNRTSLSIASAAQPIIAVADPPLAASPILSLQYPIRTTGIPASQAPMLVTEEMSESPTDLAPPATVGQPQGLGSPIALPLRPEAAVSPPPDFVQAGDLFAESQTMTPSPSPPAQPTWEASTMFPESTAHEPPAPIPSPKQPAPGTVNPMDIMPPSNQTEINWKTTALLHHLTNSPAPAVDMISEPAYDPTTMAMHYMNGDPTATVTPQQLMTPVQPVDDGLPALIQAIVTRPTLVVEPQHTVMTDALAFGSGNGNGNLVPPPAPHRTSQDSDRSDISGLSGISGSTGISGGSYQSGMVGGGPSDFSPSPQYLGGPSSGLGGAANHATPRTPYTENSGSPESEGSSHIQNSVSPYSMQAASPSAFVCDECGRDFDQIHKLNHHKRYHERPHECTERNCGKRFGTKTHLDRHINDKHRKTKQFHCTEQSCAYSRHGGKSFPRKDNWRRHMINIHQRSPESDPEPDVVDIPMGGT